MSFQTRFLSYYRFLFRQIVFNNVCNSLSVQITTGYNLEDDRCECVALQDYKKNEQVNTFASGSVLPVRSSILLRRRACRGKRGA